MRFKLDYITGSFTSLRYFLLALRDLRRPDLGALQYVSLYLSLDILDTSQVLFINSGSYLYYAFNFLYIILGIPAGKLFA